MRERNETSVSPFCGAVGAGIWEGQLGLSVGNRRSGCVCVAASAGRSVHICTALLMGTSIQRWLLLKKKKQLSGANGFPGPNTPEKLERVGVLGCPSYTACWGSRMRPHPPPSTPRRVQRIILHSEPSYSRIQRLHQNTSHTQPLLCAPQAPEREELGLQGARARA